MQLSKLRTAGLLDWTTSGFIVHDLYRDYAVWYVRKDDDEENLLWIDKKGANEEAMLPRALHQKPVYNCWHNLIRVRLSGYRIDDRLVQMIQELRPVVVLIFHCMDNLTTLDLGGLACLQHLEMEHLHNLKEIEVPESLKFMWLFDLPSLERILGVETCSSLRDIEIQKCPRLGDFPSMINCDSCGVLEQPPRTLSLDTFLQSPQISDLDR